MCPIEYHDGDPTVLYLLGGSTVNMADLAMPDQAKFTEVRSYSIPNKWTNPSAFSAYAPNRTDVVLVQNAAEIFCPS